MSKTNKTLTVVLIIAIVVTLSLPAIAASSRKADLYYRDIKITLDGKQLTPTDVNGNAVDPFIIDGTTYLPVRAVSEALGLNVDWDNDTSTVILTRPGYTPPAEPGTVTTEMKNALATAQSYLKYTAFSREGLIGQLEYENFSHDAAVYAVDHVGADWNEQAAKKAESYMKYSSFSRERLIEQLEHEGFTHEQAVYGVTAVGY